MATANFWTMQNFDLYAVDDDFSDDETDPQIINDMCAGFYHYVEDALNLDDVNDGLTFHEISLKSGYYCGIQIYVNEKDNPHNLDNYETNYYFAMCRSIAIRRYDAEIRKIRRWMEKTLPPLGFMKLHVVARFSNGETFYAVA